MSFVQQKILNLHLNMLVKVENFVNERYFHDIGRSRGSRCRVVVHIFDCNIEASEFQLPLSYYIQFQTTTLEKGLRTITHHQRWIIQWHNCSSTRMAFALSNPLRDNTKPKKRLLSKKQNKNKKKKKTQKQHA